MATKSATKGKTTVASRRVVKKTRLKRNLKIALVSIGTVILIGGGGGLLFMLAQLRWADEQLASSLRDKLNFARGTETVMVARDGKTIIYTSSNETRDPIDHYSDIPVNVIHATLAAEDKRYFEHSGVDYKALFRSTVADLREGKAAQGGSTITMQLVKRLYTSPEKTFTRKVRDVALAIEIEKRLTKEEILQDYLNQVYYGQGAYGIKAAAEVYFNKSNLSKLTVSEAALLARLVRRPSDENPFKDRKKSISNRNEVLATEEEMGWITHDQYTQAKSEKLHLAPKHFGSGERKLQAKYFVSYVLDTLKKDMPDVDFASGGYTIETTVDPQIEKYAEEEVKDVVHANRRRHITTAAFMLMNSDGEILAMVGGTDFEHHQYNAVVQGRRQPGSSFKPIVYSTALARGDLSPGDSISSGAFHYVDPYTGDSWDPENDNGFGGYVSIATALAGSINTCSARVCQKTGPENVVAFAHGVFGYTSPISPVMSIALGSQAVSPLEQAQAYSVFQSHGDRATPFGITRVLGPDGSVVKEYGPNIHKGVLREDVAAQMDIYLRGVVTGGTGRRAYSVKDARGKTGTTQDNRDAWFCGYTNNLIGIAWVANEKYDPNHKPPYWYDPMYGVFGADAPTTIWTDVMKEAQDKYGNGAPLPPSHMDRSVDVDATVAKSMNQERRRRERNADNSDDSADTQNTNNDGDTQDNSAPDNKSDQNQDNGDTPSTPTTPPETQNDTPQDTPAPPPRSTARHRRSAPTEMVTVNICADTGLLANRYCPETVARTYVRGTEPTRVCTKHHE